MPRLSKTWIEGHLPPSAARNHMLSLDLDVVNGSDGDADGMSAVSLMVKNYGRAVKRVSFGGWQDVGEHGVPRHVPILEVDSKGTILSSLTLMPQLHRWSINALFSIRRPGCAASLFRARESGPHKTIP